MERYNITKKEYESKMFDRVENFNLFKKIFYPKNYILKYKDIFKYTQNNKEYFIEKFGKQDFRWVSEYVCFAWGFKFPNGILVVFSGNGGTSYEFDGSPNKDDVKEFEELLNIVKLS